MKTVVMTGASGVVGARALKHLLARDDVGKVVALGRRPLTVQHPKLVSAVADLRTPVAMTGAMPDRVDVAVCCLGTTMRQAGSQEAFRAVDLEAVLAFGEAARSRGAARFLLVSAVGANRRSRNFYLRIKGEAEEGLRRLGYPQVTILRPSFIDDEGARHESRPGERVGLSVARAVFAVIGSTRRFAPIRAEVIARALVRLAFDDTRDPVRIVQSEQLHALGA